MTPRNFVLSTISIFTLSMITSIDIDTRILFPLKQNEMTKIRNIISEVKIKPKNDIMYPDIFNCICQNKKWRYYIPYVKTTVQLLFKSRYPKGPTQSRVMEINWRNFDQLRIVIVHTEMWQLKLSTAEHIVFMLEYFWLFLYILWHSQFACRRCEVNCITQEESPRISLI